MVWRCPWKGEAGGGVDGGEGQSGERASGGGSASLGEARVTPISSLCSSPPTLPLSSLLGRTPHHKKSCVESPCYLYPCLCSVGERAATDGRAFFCGASPIKKAMRALALLALAAVATATPAADYTRLRLLGTDIALSMAGDAAACAATCKDGCKG